VAPPTCSAAPAPRFPEVEGPERLPVVSIATSAPKSPIRLTMNAFFPASALALSVNRNH
jgi:hypothetical protein